MGGRELCQSERLYPFRDGLMISHMMAERNESSWIAYIKFRWGSKLAGSGSWRKGHPPIRTVAMLMICTMLDWDGSWMASGFVRSQCKAWSRAHVAKGQHSDRVWSSQSTDFVLKLSALETGCQAIANQSSWTPKVFENVSEDSGRWLRCRWKVKVLYWMSVWPCFPFEIFQDVSSDCKIWVLTPNQWYSAVFCFEFIT